MGRIFDVKAAVWAGLIAGVVFMALEMTLVATVGGDSPWAPPRMIAAIGMGKAVLPPPACFALGILVVVMLIHFALAAVLGIVFGWIVSRQQMGAAATLAAGAIFGLLVYFVGFYGMTTFFPWFAMARNAISIFAHLVFGVVLALSYLRLARPSADSPG